MRRSFLLAAALAALAVAPHAAGPQNWPSFRGPHAAGVADGQDLPLHWDVPRGAGVRWKTLIPGLAHSSPVVWGDRVFVTTAISSRGHTSFRRGLFGAGDASDDRSPHQWKLYALDRTSGRILWERTAYEGRPREKRHVKGTYANATPATDGRYVVAFFGSQGLYAYHVDGRPAWKQDLGILNAGAYNLPEYEWGNASSPIIDAGRVIVQCDVQGQSFVQAFDLETGRPIWRTNRDELPSWSTPSVLRDAGAATLVTNAPNFIRGYDPATGEERWRLGGSSKITAPTPILADGLIIVASGRAPERPIFAVRPDARGDITLPAGTASSDAVAWSRTQRGPYMATPLAYRGYLYVLSNYGVLDCYELATGQEIYRRRIPHQGSGFSASPVAADGRIYLSSEDGDIFVVRAGPEFALLATNPVGEPLMATPALAGGLLLVRGQHHLVAIG